MKSTLGYVNERIKLLTEQVLCNKSIEAIQKMLFKSFTFPYHIFPQIAGSKAFRGQTCSNLPYNSISRISYNPTPSKVIGRANLINESIFYASTSLDTSAIESCQDGIRSGIKEFFVTVGEWDIQRNLQIDIMCHSKHALSTATDLPIAAKSIDPMMRKGRTEDQYLALLAKSEFFSDQFAKSIINCPKDYAYSAIYASQIIDPKKNICDGIMYPSVAYKLKGFNIVYYKDLIDMKTIKFNCAHLVRLKFNDPDVYPEFEIQKKSSGIQNDLIIW
ncbi:MAG TPA: hypothetical protein VMV77_04975 [Bacteroidales bacterium]|nr:hypothetical protein [Bacteroidales bacterium]